MVKPLINSTCDTNKDSSQQEVAQLAHAAGGSPQTVDQVLHKADGYAVPRPDAE
ncbi:hypothetical protein SDC9_172828 [bioreactor metagenome]|uniref:Uncharacterized protein n=1 Tax=bioreactor metagenome TaxID=1076179 RepID=A0A645GI13_9ZZZZ